MTAERRGTERFCVEQARSRNLVHKTKRDVKVNQTRTNVRSESSYRREESNYNLPTLHTLTLHLETQWLPD
ncbi:unnamed protein product [Pleuronectes platessa]|uniref:Uncharacterized protein n=1 Tax=Pleuronectes platessa TaxID=8262 RepID=A0A9N7YGA6_PLEPL|nr:unnamed protein product [Pleuronectes platessa]